MNTCVIEDILAENCPSCGDLTFCNPAGYCDVLCNDMKTCTLDSCVAEQCQHDPIPGELFTIARIWHAPKGIDTQVLKT